MTKLTWSMRLMSVVGSAGRDRGVGPNRVRGVPLVGAPRRTEDQRTDGRGLGGDLRRVVSRYLGLSRDEVARDDGRHVPRTVLNHELHVRGIHVGAVLDRIDAAQYRAPDGLGTVSVSGDGVAIVMRARHHPTDLIERH